MAAALGSQIPEQQSRASAEAEGACRQQAQLLANMLGVAKEMESAARWWVGLWLSSLILFSYIILGFNIVHWVPAGQGGVWPQATAAQIFYSTEEVPAVAGRAGCACYASCCGACAHPNPNLTPHSPLAPPGASTPSF